MGATHERAPMQLGVGMEGPLPGRPALRSVVEPEMYGFPNLLRLVNVKRNLLGSFVRLQINDDRSST